MVRVAKAWKAVGHAGSVQFLVQAIQWALAAGAGLVTALLVWSSGQPAWVIILAGLAALAFALVGAHYSLALYGKFREWRQAKSAKQSQTLMLESRRSALPTKVNGDGVLASYVIIGAGKNEVHIGLLNTPYSEKERPNFDWGDDAPIHAQKITLINYGETLLRGKIVARLSVSEASIQNGVQGQGKQLFDKDISLDFERIPSGESQSVTSYIRNETPHFVDLQFLSAEGIGVDGRPVPILLQTNRFAHVGLEPARRWHVGRDERKV